MSLTLGSLAAENAANPMEAVPGWRIVQGNPYEPWMQRPDRSPGFAGLGETCWLDPIDGQKQCEPTIWTPSATSDFIHRTGDAFRAIHAEVVACRDAGGMTKAEGEEWMRLYNRWQAYMKEEPSLYWTSTATTVLSYVQHLHSWRELLKKKGKSCVRTNLKPTPDVVTHEDKPLFDMLGGSSTLKWAVLGLGALVILRLKF